MRDSSFKWHCTLKLFGIHHNKVDIRKLKRHSRKDARKTSEPSFAGMTLERIGANQLVLIMGVEIKSNALSMIMWCPSFNRAVLLPKVIRLLTDRMRKIEFGYRNQKLVWSVLRKVVVSILSQPIRNGYFANFFRIFQSSAWNVFRINIISFLLDLAIQIKNWKYNDVTFSSHFLNSLTLTQRKVFYPQINRAQFHTLNNQYPLAPGNSLLAGFAIPHFIIE